MCEGPVRRRIINEFIPRIIKPRFVTSSELWPKLLRDPMVHNITRRSASEPHSFDSLIRESPCTLQNDTSSPRCVKRSRTTAVHSPSSGSAGMWSLNVERLHRRTNNMEENHWHNNSENKSAGKRKMFDLDDNLECPWPSLTETLDEECSDETSDSNSDSETYSGPS